MSKTKNKYSVAVVKAGKKVICYLSERDIERGYDVRYDMLGFEVLSV